VTAWQRPYWNGCENQGTVAELALPPEEIDGRTLGVLFTPYFVKVRRS
jgi:hypothetical protein